ncbi:MULTISPECIES: hypothetical protein [Kosmotoga]|uniref:Uncharacterized protein n=1 Tax=Kosmotoga olearia (strain ATCC BAA-1733 / DSM 21960 / TBF 19.5.1) TaxID=521045 RepID=C5CGA2_KOSOT|nr:MULTISPECIES: hypothetical protein [Kosmotoga]ACR79543.1 hypothetical protein Kole_0833 [Kosmotoga olearia TBF 19.5.1]OAA22099.1 hypothetical protein DU53_04435 [Kosmotoga sp. DU53]
MKQFVAFLVIFGLATAAFAGIASVADAERLAKKHAKEDVRVVGTVFLGMCFPILTPVVTLTKTFSVPAERLAVAQSFSDPNITSHYISTYKKIRKTTALFWGFVGTIIDVILVFLSY